ncbi:MAG: hypothetical protein R6T98_03000 [Desulfatiglandales bacterium]
MEPTQTSIKMTYSTESAMLKLMLLKEELELIEKKLKRMEKAIEQALALTG